MDHDRENGDLGRVELRRHFKKTFKQFSICESLSRTEIHCLVYIASEIHVKITMSSESSDLETNFDSDDTEMNFIDGYELEDKGHSSRVSPWSPETLSDSSNDDVAYTDEPLADAEWIKNYQEEMKANEELERSLKDGLHGNVQLKEWWDWRVFVYIYIVVCALVRHCMCWHALRLRFCQLNLTER